MEIAVDDTTPSGLRPRTRCIRNEAAGATSARHSGSSEDLLRQTDTTNDSWPLRPSTTLAFFPYQLNLSRGRISALADILFRPQVQGRYAWRLGLGTNDQNPISTSLSLYHLRAHSKTDAHDPSEAGWGWAHRCWILTIDPCYRPPSPSKRLVDLHGTPAMTISPWADIDCP